MSISATSADRTIAQLAARQHGVVGRRQLRALGVGRGAIDHRVRTARLHPIHAGVYAVGHERLRGPALWMAAVLAGGTGAVLSHASAAALRGLRPTTRAAVDVTLPDREGGGRPGVTLHRSRRLPDVDRTLCDAIPVTTVARTLLDLAEQISPRQLERAVDEAARLRLLDVSVVGSLCARSVGRHGLAPLRAVLAGARDPLPVRSELESRFVAVCDGAKLPPPALNAVVEGYEVDVHWAQRRVVVELDGFGYHASRMAFERDRVRDAELQLAGYRVLRITARRLEREPDAIVAALRTLLASGPP